MEVSLHTQVHLIIHVFFSTTRAIYLTEKCLGVAHNLKGQIRTGTYFKVPNSVVGCAEMYIQVTIAYDSAAIHYLRTVRTVSGFR